MQRQNCAGLAHRRVFPNARAIIRVKWSFVSHELELSIFIFKRLATQNSSETSAEVNDRSLSQTALAVHNCSLYEEMRPMAFLNTYRRSLHEGCSSSNDAVFNGSAYCWFAVTLCFC
jgi:hypothetical protein